MQSGALLDNMRRPLQSDVINRFCARVPYADGRLFEEGDEMIFMLNRNKGIGP